MYFFILSLTLNFYLLSFNFFFYCKSAPATHLAVLIHDAMDATFLHGLAVVNMLRTEGSILAKNQFHAEKSHAYSNY